jgi:hypothetical protein
MRVEALRAFPEYVNRQLHESLLPLSFDLQTFQEICPKDYTDELFVTYDVDTGSGTVTPYDQDVFAKFADRAMKVNP